MSRIKDICRFYSILDDLRETIGRPRKLNESHGRMEWPSHGLYLFLEQGEERRHSGKGPRVTRVGTHAVSAGSKTKLWNRLRSHKGSTKSGGGNHRGSVFRLIVGQAILSREGDRSFPNWGKGSTAPHRIREQEHPFECRVSDYIGEMPFLWLRVDGPSSSNNLRAYIEENIIGLLSNYGKSGKSLIDPPSSKWLGNFSLREKICQSGLWNSNHVESDYEMVFLDIFENLVLKNS